MKPLLYILSIFFLLTSCKEDKKDQFARLVQGMAGKRDRVSAGYGFHSFRH